MLDVRQRSIERLQKAGLRVTTPRLTVLAVLASHPHSTVDEVIEYAIRSGESLSTQTAYNVLADLATHQIVRSVELPHETPRYEWDLGDNHHHLVCLSCHTLMDVPCAVGHAPCLVPADDHGMHILIADVIYRGLCSECLEKHPHLGE